MSSHMYGQPQAATSDDWMALLQFNAPLATEERPRSRSRSRRSIPRGLRPPVESASEEEGDKGPSDIFIEQSPPKMPDNVQEQCGTMLSSIWHADARLKIRHAVSGRYVCLPGPARLENGYTIPLHTFEVRNLAGIYVFLVQEDDKLEKPAVLCTVVLTRTTEIAHRSYLLSDCALPDGSSHDGVVRILTGNEVLESGGLAFVDVPLIDLDGFDTPPTPDLDE